MSSLRSAAVPAVQSAIQRDVLWILRQLRRLGPLPLPELRRQYGEAVVTVMERRGEVRGVATDAGVLYTVGPKGYVLTGAGRFNSPEPNALVDAFARRAAFEWFRDQGYEEWSPAQRWHGPGAGLDGDMQRRSMERYVSPSDSSGPLRETVCYLACFPGPSMITVNRHIRHTDEVVVFTTRPQAVLGRKRKRWYEKAVDWFDVAEAVRPAMGVAIRRALAAKGEVASKARRAKRTSARKAEKAAVAGGEPAALRAPSQRNVASSAPAPAPLAVSDGAHQLLADLQVDRVTTLGFAQRRYGVTRKEVEALGIAVRRAIVAATTSAQVATEVDFLLRAGEPLLARMEVARLRHLAGVTALRHLLQAPVEEWASTAEAVDASLVPDALWRERRAEGVFRAIEFDAGSYSRSQLSEKVARFQRDYGMQFWGVASEQRVAIVKSVLREQAVSGTVEFVQWW